MTRPHPSVLRAWSLTVLRAPRVLSATFPLRDEVVLAPGTPVVHLAPTCLDLATDGPLSPLPLYVRTLSLDDALVAVGESIEWCPMCVLARADHPALDTLELASRLIDAHLLAERFLSSPDLKLLGQLVRVRSALAARQGRPRTAFAPTSEARRVLDTALASAPVSLLERFAEGVGLIHLRRTAPSREYQAVCVEGVAEGVDVLRDPSRAHRLERSLRLLEGTVAEVLADLDALTAASRSILVAGEVTVGPGDAFAESLLALVAPHGGAFVACVPSLVLPYLQEHLGGTVHPLALPDGLQPDAVLSTLVPVWSSLADGLPPHQQLKLVPQALDAALALLSA